MLTTRRGFFGLIATLVSWPLTKLRAHANAVNGLRTSEETGERLIDGTTVLGRVHRASDGTPLLIIDTFAPTGAVYSGSLIVGGDVVRTVNNLTESMAAAREDDGDDLVDRAQFIAGLRFVAWRTLHHVLPLEERRAIARQASTAPRQMPWVTARGES